MLCRLKAQMVSEQDAEDDKLQWKVDAEVRSATRAAEAAAEAAKAGCRDLSCQLEAQRREVQTLESNLAAWESAVAERDAEIVNLQVRGPKTFPPFANPVLPTEGLCVYTCISLWQKKHLESCLTLSPKSPVLDA